ncbi:MAG: hypothetical protein JSW54_08110 [Fidelibacterota bacterium]|nr:MAG: hypothetical protein JSW54_08110 [Candidatus Neomarinimicrobiota bacterium]
MKSLSTGVPIWTRIISITLLIIPGVSRAQNLDAHWQSYLTLDAQVQAASESEQSWIMQEQNLREDIQSLQAGRSWYNGWIIELILARKSSQMVELADSLQAVQIRMANLEERRNSAFSTLKEVYQQILLDSQSEARLSRAQKEQAITIGEQLITQSDASFDLPDYASILNSPYEDEDIKRLVLNDLRSVLRGKLVLIDSLLSEKETEEALLKRLNEFHRDLSYQRESDLDFEAGDYQDVASAYATEKGVAAGTFTTDFGAGDRAALIEGESGPPVSMTQEPLLSEDSDFRLQGRPVADVTGWLKGKRQQYQELLRQIETELPH